MFKRILTVRILALLFAIALMPLVTGARCNFEGNPDCDAFCD